MRAVLVVCALIIVAALITLSHGIDAQRYHITQLEMALAQAHAHADTLETMLESCE